MKPGRFRAGSSRGGLTCATLLLDHDTHGLDDAAQTVRGWRNARDVTSDHMPELPVEIDSAGRSVDVEREELAADDIREPFNPEEIDVLTRTPTVDLLLARIRRGVLDLQPDFQRLSGIWTEQVQSRLIESMLLRIPLPTFYAAEADGKDDERWVIVDGIQRLTTIARFVAPESIDMPPLILRNLEYLKDYEGTRFSELPGRLQTRLVETEVVMHVIRRGTPEEVMFNIFARINTGGRPLTRQELRHALIPGPARGLLKTLAESPAYQNATLNSVSPERMDDREMVLRFIAFRLTEPEKYARQDFDDFLRGAMHTVNRLAPHRVNALRSQFLHSMDDARAIFGPHAFRKLYWGQQRRSPINKALFESVSVNLARRTRDELETLIERSDQVMDGLSALLEDLDFERAVSVGTGDVAKVRLRFSTIDEMLKEVSDD